LGGAFLLALAPGLTPASPAFADEAKPPVVFAAASMKTALDAVAEAWTAQTGKRVTISYGSSGALAKQIEAGAPADIFFSADVVWMDTLAKAKALQDKTRQSILGNRLVLVEPKDGVIGMKIAKGFDLAGALGDGKLAVCFIASCPAGIYAKEALLDLGVYPSVLPKIVQADNVRAALLLVARGEAKLGIVYATDAKAEPGVKVIDVFPDETHSPIVYQVAILKAATSPDSVGFEAFLRGEAATKIFAKQGFIILRK
jgi:molybdate transport system substrate-binding protein